MSPVAQRKRSTPVSKTNRVRPGAAGAAVLASAIALAGCGSSDNASSSSPSGGSTGAGKRVSIIVGSESDDFYKAIECGAKIRSKALGVKLDVQGPSQFDPALQVPIVNGVAARQPDVLIIAPTDDTALAAPIQAVKAAGAKVILVDTTLKDSSIAEGHIGSDYVNYGVQGAQELAKAIGDSGTVLGIFAPPGVSTNDRGREGFRTEMAKHPNIKVLPFEYSNGAPGKSAAIVSASLAAHSDLKGIFTYNGGDAQGVVTGLRQAADGNVKFVSGDAQPFQVQQLKEGAVAALVVQQARRMGEQAVQDAVDALASKPVARETAIKTVVATKANVGQPEIAANLYKGC